MKFSIVIITSNRHKELFDCLESIKKASCTHEYEIIVIFNGDRSYLEKCNLNFKEVSTYFIHKTTPAMARNVGIQKAQGEYIFFLDDDCTLPQEYFSKIDFNADWDVIGGPDQTPPGSLNIQKNIGKALSSPLCMGPTYKRHSRSDEYFYNADEKSLILCNLWFKASLFRVERFEFPPSLFRNEENYLLKELEQEGKILHYSSDLYVYHQRKADFEKLGVSIIKSGECRVQNLAMLPTLKELIYLLPLIWISSFIWIIFNPDSFLVNFFIFYTALVTIHYVVKYRSLSLMYIMLHYFILNVYAIGLLRGLWKFLPLFYSNFKENKSLINESSNK